MSALNRFAPPFLVMAAIFFLSAQPDLNSGLGTWDTILRKLAHMAEYAALWFLWWRAFRYRRALAAAMIAIGYAVTDEYHQTFVDGRTGSAADVVIDSLGIATALLLVARRR